MRKPIKRYWILAVLLLFTLVFGIRILKYDNPEVIRAVPVHPCKFYDQERFAASIVMPKSDPVSDNIRGGVIPHHLVAGYMIADFFNMLSGQDVERIILLGPNHYLRGPRIATSRYSWETAFGRLQADREIVDELIRDGIAKADEEIMPDEHSIAGLIPYIKYYLPDTRLVPLVLYWDITPREAANMGKLLEEYAGEKSVVVASVDFSHYLTMEEAEEKDRETLEAILEADYERIFRMGNDHLDSPGSIGILLQTMKNLGADNLTVLHHSNSGLVLGRETEETTSYFTLIYH